MRTLVFLEQGEDAMFDTSPVREPGRRPSPLVRLWILRILMCAGGHGRFVRRHSLGNDDVAGALGLPLSDAGDDGQAPYDPAAARRRLQAMHARAERGAAKVRLPRVMAGNLARLSATLGLTDADRRLLAFACLLHVEDVLDSATDLLGSINTTRVIRTLARILNLPTDEVGRSLGPQGLLSRSGLLVLGRHGTGCLRAKLDLLSDSFADLVTSTRVQPKQLLRGTVAVAPAPELELSDYAHLDASLDILRPYLDHALATGRRGVNVFLHGPPGTGKTQLARLLAELSRCDLFEVAGEDEDGDPVDGQRRLRAFRAAQNLLSRQRTLLLFDEVEDVFNDGSDFLGRKSTAQARKAWMNRMLEDAQVPTFWLSNSIRAIDPAFIRRFDMIIEVPVPPRSQRQRIVQRACASLVGKGCIERLANVDRLAPAVIARASSVVRAIGDGLDRPRAEQALEHLVANTLEAQGHARPLRSGVAELPDGYDTSFLNPDTDISVIADGLRESGQGRLCLYGPPGTGKTAFGRWLARQLDLPLHIKRASDLLSPWVGMTEKQLAQAFREAEQDRALLLIDEVDGFLRDRGSARQSWEASQVNEMLTCMESFAGIFVASTNLMDGLDPAALRRFDAKIHFGYLTPAQAQAMLRAQCAALGLASPGVAEERALARLSNLAPGDFAALARQHRFRRIDSPATLVELLQAECALKGGTKRTIGFLP